MTTQTLLIIFLLVFLLIIWFIALPILILKKYKNTFIGIEILDGNRKVIMSRAKEVLDGNGAKKWKLLKFWMLKANKGIIPAPSGKFVHINTKGNSVGIGFVSKSDEVIWSTIDETKSITPYIDDSLKAVYKNQLQKIEAERGNNVFMTIMNNAAIIALVMVVFALLVFGKDAMMAWQDAKSEAVGQYQAVQKNTIELQKQINTGCFFSKGGQIIGGETLLGLEDDANETIQ